MSTRAAVLTAFLTLPLGLVYELIWDLLTALLAFIVGSPELLNRAVRACGLFCWGNRPTYFSLAPNMRVFRIKLLLEPVLNALLQAIVQVRACVHVFVFGGMFFYDGGR